MVNIGEDSVEREPNEEERTWTTFHI
jgi:hypothetical protein